MTDDREAQLLEEIAKRDELLARQGDKIAALEAETRFLREKIDALVRRVFGSRREKRTPPRSWKARRRGLDPPHVRKSRNPGRLGGSGCRSIFPSKKK